MTIDAGLKPEGPPSAPDSVAGALSGVDAGPERYRSNADGGGGAFAAWRTVGCRCWGSECLWRS